MASMFTKARNNRFKNNTFTVNTNNFNAVPGQALNILYINVAPNAILNTGGRADEVRCHPGTRKEVIGLINKWRLEIQSNVKNNHLFWLSGPAGAGKTAIVQSVAEDWKSSGTHTASFFFFRTDPSRSHAKSFVATLLYQIFDFCPPVRNAVEKVLTAKPRILDAGLEEQVNELICATFRSMHPTFSEKITLLIDGLDECDSETKTSQKHILHVLDQLVGQTDLPFLVLVASRAEPHISTMFNQLTSQALPVFLDDQFSPERDIRLFVTAEFVKIKNSHPLASLLQSDWPSDSDVDGIVWKSSGQFIYAATIMRFLSQSSAVPSLSLERVQGIVPCAKNSPFVHLDAFYTYILQQADDHKAICDIFSAALLDERTAISYIKHMRRRVTPGSSISEQIPPSSTILDSSSEHYNDTYHELPPISDFLQLCDARYTTSLVMSCISDISTIVLFHDGRLKFYHASLPDFLLDQSRSKLFHVDVEDFVATIMPRLWDYTLHQNWHQREFLGMALFGLVKHSTPAITNLLLSIRPSDSDKFNSYFMEPSSRSTNILQNFVRLYYTDDFRSYKRILKRWITWAVFRCDSDNQLQILAAYGESSINEWRHWLGLKGNHDSVGIPLFGKYLALAKMRKQLSMGAHRRKR